MQFATFTKAVLVLLLGLSALPSFAQAQQSLTPIYRSFKEVRPGVGDHLFSGSATEGPSQGWRDEGLVFFVFKNPGRGLIPLYRCQVGELHMLSTDQGCEGFRTEGALGYIVPPGESKPGVVPLFRFFNPKNGQHISVTSPRTELIANWTNESVQGHVVPRDNNDMLGDVPSLPQFTCTLNPLSTGPSISKPFIGIAVTREVAMHEAQERCRASGIQPWSVCMPDLGAEVRCRQTRD